jgi:ribosome-associated protein
MPRPKTSSFSTSLADAMLIASGRSDRHVGAIAERVMSAIKDRGLPAPKVEGMPVCDWVLIDTGDIIIHLFRPEVRGFYNLEKLWGMGRPQEEAPAVKVETADGEAKVTRPRRVTTIKSADPDQPKKVTRPRAKAALKRED